MMKRKKIDFLIRYEHKVRELESVMLIKIELERRGYTVDLIGNYEYNRKDFPKPKVLVSPAIYNNDQLWWDLFRYGMIKKISNLLWEQLMGIEEEEDVHGFHNVTGMGTRIINFCWGKNSHERIIRGGVQKDKAPVVGQVNTDLLRWDFQKILLGKEELSKKYQVDASKKWYLFISSFAFCEMDPLQENIATKAWGKENVDYFKEVSSRTRLVILDWFENQLKKHPEILIIYRPHPDETEKCDRLRQLALNYSNFKVIAQEALKQWVNASDKIYNWYSTGIVDAVVLEKPIRMLRPYPIKRELDYRIMYSANSITNQEEFENDFIDISKKGIIEKELFASYYYLPDKPVYIQICDILEEMLTTNKYNIRYTLNEWCYHLKEKFKWNSIWFINNHIVSKMSEKLYPSFYKKAIETKKVRLLSYCNGYAKNVATDEEIQELYNRLKPIVYEQSNCVD